MAIIIFHDMIYKVEVYVNDMMVKLKTQEEHPATLEKFMQQVDKYNMRLNPKFGVTSRKMLGHIIS